MSLADYLDEENGKLLTKIEEDLLSGRKARETSPQPTVWKEHVMQLNFPAHVVEFAFNNWKPKPTDVLIISFPKTGTTWMREILRQILYRNNPSEMEISKHISLHLQYLEMGPVEKFKVLDSIPLGSRVIATHTTPHTLNLKSFQDAGCKIIFCYRNPRDQLVSLLHHFTKGPSRPTILDGVAVDRTWKGFYEQNIKGEIVIGMKPYEGYIEFLNRWHPIIKGNPNDILLVAYENMIKDFSKELSTIANHIGVSLTQAEADHIEQTCSIGNMKKNEVNDESTIEDKLRMKWNLVRQGGIGQWKKYFNEDQVKQMNEKINKDLTSDIFNFIYE